MNSRIINPFFEATLHILKKMSKGPIKASKPFLKGSVEQMTCDVISVASLSSRNFDGVVALCFPKEVFLAMLSGMFKEYFSRIPDRYEDGAAELLNIILGHVRVHLSKEGYEVDHSIPSSSSDGEREVPHYTPSQTFVLPFLTKDGPFYVEVGLQAAVAQNRDTA